MSEEHGPKDSPKQDGPKQDGSKQDSSKDAGPKQDRSKDAGPKENGSKQHGPKQDSYKDAGPKQDGPQEDGPKQNSSKETGSKETVNDPTSDNQYDVLRSHPSPVQALRPDATVCTLTAIMNNKGRDANKTNQEEDGSKEIVNDATSDNQDDAFSNHSSPASTITTIVNDDGKDADETNQGEREPKSLNMPLHSDPQPCQPPGSHTVPKDVKSLITSAGKNSLNLQLHSNLQPCQPPGLRTDSKDIESLTGQNSQRIVRESNHIELNSDREDLLPSVLRSVNLSLVQAVPEKTNTSNFFKLALWKDRKGWNCLLNCTSSEQIGLLSVIGRSLYNAWNCVIVNDHCKARRILSGLEIIITRLCTAHAQLIQRIPLIRLAIYKVQSLLALLEGNKRGLLALLRKTTELLRPPYLPGEVGQAAWVYLHYGRSIEDGKNYWMDRARQLFQQDRCMCSSIGFQDTIAAHGSTIIPNRDTVFQEFYTELVDKPLICHTFEFFL